MTTYVYALPPPDDRHRTTVRAHRGLAIPGSVLLLLAMFLPALRVCDDPLTPLQFPFVLPPYLFGGTALIVYLVTSPGARRAWGVVARVFGGLTLALVGLVGSEATDNLSMALCLAGLIGIVLTCIPGKRPAEQRLAVALAIPATAAAVMFGGVLQSKDAMYGTGVALAGAVLLALGALHWAYAARHLSDEAPAYLDPMPRAILR